MDTISKRLKDAVRHNIQDGCIYSNEGIRQLIYDGTGMRYKVEYKETHFAGCLSALKKSGEIIQVERGAYRKGAMKRQAWNDGITRTEMPEFSEKGAEKEVSITQIKKDIMQSVSKELSFLREAAKNIVLSFDTPEEDIQYMLKLKELERYLEEFELQMNE